MSTQQESSVQRNIMLKASKLGCTLFRNNVAIAWIGKSYRANRIEHYVLQPGDVVVSNARRLHSGLIQGSSDLIGWCQRDGTAVFTAIECKSAKGKASEQQKTFINNVNKAGGIAGIARCEDDLVEILSNYS